MIVYTLFCLSGACNGYAVHYAGCLMVVAVLQYIVHVLVVKWLLCSNKLHNIAVAKMIMCRVF